MWVAEQDVSVKTQSRSAMESALSIDNLLGMRTGNSCQNMPTIYTAVFDRF